jgi:rhamnopyranosyl-N-acetylglucosaminyl-diphospho-decaprenol beta-1,3/1,4-galactofuranosyltransferase
VIVVDNASSDGTAAFLAEKRGLSPSFHVVRLERNDGSAGGFVAGVAAALERGHDRLWLLDDDTIPSPTALEALLDAPDAALLCSHVEWTDGTLHPMNAPWPRWDRPASALDAIERGLLEVRAATYVSVLVDRAAVERHGPPRVPFFIWGDDVEFTARLLREETGYYVPGSVVVHKTATPYAASRSDSPRYAIDVRNKLWMLRADDVWTRGEKLWWASLAARNAVEYVRFNRWRPRAALVVLRGIRDGLASRPS